ncbi:plasmid replication protein RepC [Sagittula salina]|uniref:Replication initiation protein n=1 Tax=Sagittula salina TaxID=2820268 RepID=A0A940MN78_9RHOB|nr:plasmid replication protein RepC [Sagittula salina]MBP0485005.1 replication initiation protein [Sagittula salina]
MERLTVTPFGRQAMTAGLLASQAAACAPAEWKSVGKWEIFRALRTGRLAWGVSDRDLTVLNALLTFLPADRLEDDAALVVYPSNRVLAERAHGMAESTLRRHLAALVKTGLICRHDSPNGKRYARRNRAGEVISAFGFDLRPLLVRAPEIVTAAESAQAEAETLRLLRERVVLACRDAVKLLLHGRDAGLPGTWDAWDDALRLIQRALRRKLDRNNLAALETATRDVLEAVTSALTSADETVENAVRPQIDTVKVSGRDAENERHLQNSDKDNLESEPGCEHHVQEHVIDKPRAKIPPVPLPLILTACPDIASFSPGSIKDWPDLIAAGERLHRMLGIDGTVWRSALRVMGACDAAVTLACMVQRAGQIQSPGAYLRSLTLKAANGAFSTGPMVMALLNTKAGQAA